MALFLTGFIIGLICTVSATFLYDDLRFVPRHMLCALIMALGFGVVMPFGKNSTSQNQLGLMIMLSSVVLWVHLDQRHRQAPKRSKEQ